MIDLSFQLKGSAITVVILALLEYDPATLSEQLKARIDQAPQFFANSPVLINVEKLNESGVNALQNACDTLLNQCRLLGLQPIGFSGVPEALENAVQKTGLAVLPKVSERALKIPSVEQAVSTTEIQIETVIEERLVQRVSRVITKPIRSGQQIYAEGADLIVLAQVSEGAEVLADGHIHVYGALRGRALAGVRGDVSARIFCQHMDAELVSIAGNFLLRDSFSDDVLKKPVQVHLDGESLMVEALAS